MKSKMILLLFVVATVGCTAKRPEYLDALLPVAHPSYSAMEEVTQRQFLDLRKALEDQTASPDSRFQLATAFGAIGEVYHAYGLASPAAECYRNAQLLDPKSFAWSYLLGIASQTAGLPEQAEESFQRALALRPESPEVLFRLGMLALELGHQSSARSFLEALLEIEGFRTAASLGLARAHMADGNTQEAMVLLEQTLVSQPRLGEAHHLLSRAHRLLGNDELSNYHLSAPGGQKSEVPDRLLSRIEALAIGSGAYLRRGNRALVSGNLEAAVGFFRTAVDIAPTNSELRRSLAHALVQMGELHGAMTELDAAIATDPDNPWLHLDLGNTASAAGLADRALASFRQAVNRAPELTKARFNLANALMAAEHWAEALENLEAIAELGADDQRSRYLTAIAWHRIGQSEEALESLRHELEFDPSNQLAIEGIGTILVEADRLEEALSVYRRAALTDGPIEQRSRWCSLWANLEWRLRRTERALEAWQLGAELSPVSASARLELANGLQLVGRREEAISEFQMAADLEPANPIPWLSEGRLRILLGDYESAKTRLREAVRLHPNHAQLSATLARLLATCPLPGIRDGRLALALARKAYALEASLDHSETVAMALAELGLFEEAIQWQQGLLRQATIVDLRPDAQRLVRNLRLYQGRQAVRFSN